MLKKGLIELALENTEVVIDQLNENGLLKDIPFVGNAFKVASIAKDIRDRIFISKLAKFIFSLDEVSEEDKNKMAEKLKNNQEEAKIIAEKIILVIDRITDLEKSEIIANVFIAYIKEQLNLKNLYRILDAIDKAYIEDLQQLLGITNLDIRLKESFLFNLLSTGFVQFSVSDKFGELGQTYYELSNIGRRFVSANKIGRQLRN